MTALTNCLFYKFGYCKFDERCKNHHIYKMKKAIVKSLHANKDILMIVDTFGRCRFSPSAFNHETVTQGNKCKDMKTEVKIVIDKILALENVINCQNLQI